GGMVPRGVRADAPTGFGGVRGGSYPARARARMAATISRPMPARLIRRLLSGRPRAAGTRRAGWRLHGDVQVLQRRLLQVLELDERFAVVEDRLQLVVLRRREIALRLNHVVVGRHADLE